jgi:hypothetical protein
MYVLAAYTSVLDQYALTSLLDLNGYLVHRLQVTLLYDDHQCNTLCRQHFCRHISISQPELVTKKLNAQSSALKLSCTPMDKACIWTLLHVWH